MKRVIVTGGNGFIGTHLLKRLLSTSKLSVAVIANSPRFRDKYLQEISQEGTRMAFHLADIRDKRSILNIFKDEKADTCIHLAAKTSVADSIKNPEETMDINVKGTINVLEACYENQTRNFVFASSAAVYGDARELPISENHSLDPLSPYGKSKMLSEEHVTAFSKARKIKNSTILRIFNVYGYGQTNQSDVITKFVEGLKKKQPPVIYGNGVHTRDFISVDDVVDSILLSSRLLEKNNIRNNDSGSPFIFNIGTGIPTSINTLAQKIIEIYQLDLTPVYQQDSEANGVILHSYADITKAREILHFVPKKEIATGLKEMIAYSGLQE